MSLQCQLSNTVILGTQILRSGGKIYACTGVFKVLGCIYNRFMNLHYCVSFCKINIQNRAYKLVTGCLVYESFQ